MDKTKLYMLMESSGEITIIITKDRFDELSEEEQKKYQPVELLNG